MFADKIVEIARSQNGYREGFTHGHWNNREKYAHQVPGLGWVNDGGFPWCAVFVSWCALQAYGDQSTEFYPRTASTDTGADWFKAKNQWSEYPAVAAQVFYGHNGDMSHTGIVAHFDDEFIYAWEGNTNTSGSAEGDGVHLMKRRRTDEFIQGYGYPSFPDGLKSADPKYKAPKAAQPAAPVSYGKNFDDALKAARRAAHANKGGRLSVARQIIKLVRSLKGKK